ncbi:MAG: hypothetical protein CMJ27_07845 [Phycisphaerae bacterium]|nr:hypothetical protein [Phycisphaerae bacterium]
MPAHRLVRALHRDALRGLAVPRRSGDHGGSARIRRRAGSGAGGRRVDLVADPLVGLSDPLGDSHRRFPSQRRLRLVDVGFNDVNGGSFHFEATHAESTTASSDDQVDRIAKGLRDERDAGFETSTPLLELGERVRRGCGALVEMLEDLRAKGDRVVGYGASTKGNVLLQYAGIGPELMPAIGEVNPNKYGCRTPGTGIPIVSDEEARALDPTHYLVLPWHFREEILPRETEFRDRGGRVSFRFPNSTWSDPEPFHGPRPLDQGQAIGASIQPPPRTSSPS